MGWVATQDTLRRRSVWNAAITSNQLSGILGDLLEDYDLLIGFKCFYGLWGSTQSRVNSVTCMLWNPSTHSWQESRNACIHRDTGRLHGFLNPTTSLHFPWPQTAPDLCFASLQIFEFVDHHVQKKASQTMPGVDPRKLYYIGVCQSHAEPMFECTAF